MKTFILFFIICFSNMALGSNPSRADINKAKDAMIFQSIKSYKGNCPCPYNYAKNSKRCGNRSAYSRPGGAAPFCFRYDIKDEAAIKYLRSKSS